MVYFKQFRSLWIFQSLQGVPEPCHACRSAIQEVFSLRWQAVSGEKWQGMVKSYENRPSRLRFWLKISLCKIWAICFQQFWHSKPAFAEWAPWPTATKVLQDTLKVAFWLCLICSHVSFPSLAAFCALQDVPPHGATASCFTVEAQWHLNFNHQVAKSIIWFSSMSKFYNSELLSYDFSQV